MGLFGTAATRMLVAFAILAWTLAPVGAAADEPEDYVEGEVIVALRRASDLGSVAKQYGLAPTPKDRFGSRAIYQIAVADGTDAEDKAEQLERDSRRRVLYAEANYEAQAPEARRKTSWHKEDTAGEYGAQWAPGKLRLAEAHAITQGAGVTIAVLDTGVDAAHPALAGKLVAGYDFDDDDADPREVGAHDTNAAYGHGTHVASLASLVAPDAKIMPLRVLDPDGATNSWVLAEALTWAASRGAGVVNMSLGTTHPTDLLEDAVGEVSCSGDDDDDDGEDCRYAGGRGVFVAAAAGNSGTSTVEYPAGEQADGVLAVAASTEADALADFSTRGPWVHVAAPGENIVGAIPGGGYASWSGSSMASPLAAGAAALARAREPGMDASNVASHLRSSAWNIGGDVPLRIDAAKGVGR